MNKKVLISFLLATGFLTAYGQENITTLLSTYEEAMDLTNKTRTESLGSYILFTRKDLEMMQANKLSDVLKSISLHTYVQNSFGVYQPIAAGMNVGLPTSYRLFINDHEVSSIHTDNPFLIYDNYPLDAIDHIEIYFGAGAVRIGNEPSLVIIKLYTKEPERENASVLKTTLSTTKDYGFSFTDARTIKDKFNYLVSVYHGYDNFKSQFFNNTPLDRDSLRQHAFLQFKYKDTSIDLGFSRIKRNAFIGLATDKTPDLSKTESQDAYISITQYLLDDKSLKLNLTYDENKRKGEFSNDNGLYLPFLGFPNYLFVKYYYENRTLRKYTFYTSKEFKSDDNVFLIGGSVKIKDNDIQEGYYKDKLKFNRQNIYTIFVENQYNINERNLLFLGLKYDHYQRDDGLKDLDKYIARIGFISYLKDNLYIKGFLTDSYVPPSFYEIEFSKNPKDLKSEDLKGGTIELNYQKKDHKLRLFYGHSIVKDLITFGLYGSYNYEKTVKSDLFMMEYEYVKNPDKRIYFSIYKNFINSSNKFSPTFGWFTRYLQSKDKFDFFGELIYREGFTTFDGTKVSQSYNLNTGIIYHYSQNFSIKLKGENLLNSSPKSVFIAPTAIFNSYDRKILLTIEKVF